LECIRGERLLEVLKTTCAEAKLTLINTKLSQLHKIKVKRPRVYEIYPKLYNLSF
ncbi:hypothetical protein GIB67_020758, partial [Kingdonia uniflora]